MTGREGSRRRGQKLKVAGEKEEPWHPPGEQEKQPSLQQVEMEEVEDGETVAGSWAFIVGEASYNPATKPWRGLKLSAAFSHGIFVCPDSSILHV